MFEQDALDTLEISHQDQENVFELLAAILWLGNISFAVINERVEIKADEGTFLHLGVYYGRVWICFSDLVF